MARDGGPDVGQPAGAVGPASGEPLTAGAVARRLGVAVTTLRTWHRRYGLGPGRHVPGHHRRYTAEDLARLQVMHRLTGHGVTAAEAAAIARRTVPDLQPAQLDAASTAPPCATAGARSGGGTIIGAGRAGPTARGLARAAMRLDATGMRELLQNAIEQYGVIPTWETVVVPVLVGIGERHTATGGLVEVEHLVSRCVSEALGTSPRPMPGHPSQVLLACADEEQHSLPLEALAAALAERQVPSRLLGARVPADALAAAVTRTGPRAVVVWSHSPATAGARTLVRLLSMRGRPLLVAAAGPGWTGVELPVEIALPGSLTEAVQDILAVVAPPR